MLAPLSRFKMLRVSATNCFAINLKMTDCNDFSKTGKQEEGLQENKKKAFKIQKKIAFNLQRTNKNLLINESHHIIVNHTHSNIQTNR